MNIDWLRYFIIISETKSFREAADKIGITSPALSKAIVELEKYYKVTLIRRKNKFESLTPAGELLFELSKNIIYEINDIENKMSDFVEGEPQGKISICSDALVQNYLLPKVIINIIEKYPKIYPQMYLMISDIAEKNVLEGHIDFGIITKKPLSDNLEYLYLMNVEHVIVGQPQYKKNWEDFSYIIPRFFGLKNHVFVDGWNDNIYKRKSIIEVEGLETTIKFCENSSGVAFLPIICVEKQLKNGSLSIVSEAPFKYDDKLFLIWSKNKAKNQSFFKVLEEIKNKLTNN
jgi:DNA-binding transcriptional LysR family regulator